MKKTLLVLRGMILIPEWSAIHLSKTEPAQDWSATSIPNGELANRFGDETDWVVGIPLRGYFQKKSLMEVFKVSRIELYRFALRDKLPDALLLLNKSENIEARSTLFENSNLAP